MPAARRRRSVVTLSPPYHEDTDTDLVPPSRPLLAAPPFFLYHNYKLTRMKEREDTISDLLRLSGRQSGFPMEEMGGNIRTLNLPVSNVRQK